MVENISIQVGGSHQTVLERVGPNLRRVGRGSDEGSFALEPLRPNGQWREWAFRGLHRIHLESGRRQKETISNQYMESLLTKFVIASSLSARKWTSLCILV